MKLLRRYIAYGITFILICTAMPVVKASTEDEAQKIEEVQQRQMAYYMEFENLMTPWYYLAAIDQYERNIQKSRDDIPKNEGVIAIQFTDEFWSGILNPMESDTSPYSIDYFYGMGLDGNGDGVADKNNDEDVLRTMVNYLSKYGSGESQFKLALWDYYKNEFAVNQIMVTAKLFEKLETIDLSVHTFPISIASNYSYSNTWGANRGWGGRRSHEGTDIFASYGTPVVAASYGVIEVMGWNQFGGWRIGIRNHLNSYHYYAHLMGFAEGLQVGDIVEVGQVIGYVGSSGYGVEGTAGKFPPHLHYGIYKFNGRTEWAFDPYPFLLQWERAAKKAG